ncbi:hypothetical protein CEAn_00205 [Coxiella endosymbiont of Amblyomma nuttalli]|nr:hypothetical protein CEAn_00205 [Coxiella endosymbiont of Amblyomma nuttalli]
MLKRYAKTYLMSRLHWRSASAAHLVIHTVFILFDNKSHSATAKVNYVKYLDYLFRTYILKNQPILKYIKT